MPIYGVNTQSADYPSNGAIPANYDRCDWRYLQEDENGDMKRGRHPAFWKYVCHGACHWLVNFNLRLAMLVEPNRKWRILHSEKHSTAWDGETTLFDMNMLALEVPPEECFRDATYGRYRELVVGRYRRTYEPVREPYEEQKRKYHEQVEMRKQAELYVKNYKQKHQSGPSLSELQRLFEHVPTAELDWYIANS